MHDVLISNARLVIAVPLAGHSFGGRNSVHLKCVLSFITCGSDHKHGLLAFFADEFSRPFIPLTIQVEGHSNLGNNCE